MPGGAHQRLGYLGVAWHELHLENGGSEHPVFSTTLAFDGYKWSSMGLTDRSLTGRAYVNGVRNYQNLSEMNSDVQYITLQYEVATEVRRILSTTGRANERVNVSCASCYRLHQLTTWAAN